MKHLLKPALGAVCFAVILLLAVYSCKKPTEGLNIIVTTDALSKSPTLVQFVNSNTASATPIPANITVNVDGPDKELVQTDDGSNSSFKAVNGYLALSLHRNAKPTPANPVVFTLSAEVPGYMPFLKTITITNDTARLFTVISLVEYNKPAAGISVLNKSASLTAGVAKELTFNMPATLGTPEAVSLTVEDGTELQNLNGALIDSKTLFTKLVYIGTSQAAYQAFPGGFNTTNAIGPNGTILPKVTFVTAGSIAINMTSTTTEVKHFSKPLEVSMEINSDLVNPLTGNKVKVGDAIPLWSMDEETGIWKYESGDYKVFQNANGKLAVNFKVTHLSIWALNWYSAPCASNLNLSLTIPGAASAVYNGYAINLVTANEQFLSGLTADNSWAYTVDLFNGAKFTFGNLPANLGKVKVAIYAKAGDLSSKIFESPLFTPCSAGSLPITLSAPQVPAYISTDIKIEGKCKSKEMIAYPTTWMFLKDVTDNDITPVYMVNGKLKVKLISGHRYSMKTTYNGKSVGTAEFMADQSISMTIAATTGLGGTATYNAATNTITIDATFTLATCG